MLTRRTAARQTREEAAELAFLRLHPQHLSNGEEAAYRSPSPLNRLSYIANYSKGLPHDPVGEVDPAAYRALLQALTSGDPNDFEQIPLGAPNGRKFVNPQAGLGFDLEGPDAQSLAIPPAPRIDGPENASEMGELYWMALLRDVSFTNYTAATPDVVAAANSLSPPPLGQFTNFRGPKNAAGNVTPATLFRGFTPGDLVGPYVSQFLLQPITFGTLLITQRQRTTVAGADYMTDFVAWRNVQNGAPPASANVFDPVRRFIRNLRDLATYVHFDALYEAYLNACLILLDMGAPFDPGNPYENSHTQHRFGTFGPPHILSLVSEVATRALKAVWFQKWFVHRRLRPEAFGGLIQVHLRGVPPAGPFPGVPPGRYPIVNAEILNLAPGSVLQRINAHNVATFGNDTFLLPQAFPEGCPTHPAYGAGHATVAGACVTILKAWFDESFILPNPQVPNAAGTALVPLAPPVTLTVGGELNKLAANIAIGRNAAGVHLRSDYTESLKLGEAIAIGILEEQKLTYNDPNGLTLTKFDGTAITI
jgi:hypothetical protein